MPELLALTDPQLAAAATLGTVGLVFAFLFGANIGSFVNVVAHRLPMELSVVKPRSRCPACRTPVRAIDNIPVLSWVLLQGRCRGCKGRISPRYALVEIFMGLLSLHSFFVLVAGPGRALDGGAWMAWVVVFVLTASWLAASLIDLDHTFLPDRITITGMWAAPALVAFVPEVLLGPELRIPNWMPLDQPVPLAAALVSGCGVAAGAGVIWALGVIGSRVFGKEAMGFGDVKFLGMIGGFVGPGGAIVVLVLAAFVGAVAGIARTLLTGDRYIPFGPFLALGAYAVLLHRPDLLDAWIDFSEWVRGGRAY